MHLGMGIRKVLLVLVATLFVLGTAEFAKADAAGYQLPQEDRPWEECTILDISRQRLQVYGLGGILELDKEKTDYTAEVTREQLISTLNNLFGLEITGIETEEVVTREEFEQVIADILQDTTEHITVYNFTPVGVSNKNFTYGDLIVYIDYLIQEESFSSGLSIKQYLIDKGIVVIGEKMTLSDYFLLLPESIDDVLEQMQYVAEYMPSTIRVRTNENFSDVDLLEAYKLVIEYLVENGGISKNSFLQTNVDEGYIFAYSCGTFAAQDAKVREAVDNKRVEVQKQLTEFGIQNNLTDKEIESMTTLGYWGYYSQMSFSIARYSNTYKVNKEATDDAFNYLDDVSVIDKLDEVYNSFATAYKITENSTDYEKVIAAEKYIVNAASYDYNYKERISNAKETSTSHSFVGFLENRKIVCDGYADLFQYLTNRMGIDSIIVSGDTSAGLHTWNKVKIDGNWYNEDVCWADTDRTNRYTLKSDTYFEANDHHADDYTDGVYMAPFSWGQANR